MADVTTKLAVMFTADTSAVESGVGKMSKGLGGLVDGLGKIGLAGMGIGAITGAVTGAAGAVGDLIGKAEGLGDAQARVDLVFKGSSDTVTKWAGSNAAAFGLSKQAALDATGGLGQYLTNLGMTEEAAGKMSTTSVEMAAKLGAFTGKSTEEAMAAIQKGLGGATRGLKEMGISIDSDLLKGLDKAGQAQVIYEQILKQSANAQAAWAGNSGDVEVSMARVSAAVENVQASIGEKLLPIIAPVAEAFASALPGAIEMATTALDKVSEILGAVFAGIDWPAIQEMVGGAFASIGEALAGIDWAAIGETVKGLAAAFMEGLGVAIPIVVGVLKTLWEIIGPLVPVIATVAGAFLLLSNPIGLAIAAITAIGAAVNLLGPAWESVKTLLADLGAAIVEKWEEFKAVISLALAFIGEAIAAKWAEFKAVITDTLAAIAETIRLQWDAFLRAISEKLDAILDAVTKAWEAVKTAITEALDTLKTAMTDAWEAMRGIVDGALTAIKGVVDSALGAVRDIFDTQIAAVKNIVSIALDLITGNWTGAFDKMKTTVDTVLGNIRAIVDRVLGALPEAISRPLGDALTVVTGWVTKVTSAVHDTATNIFNNAKEVGQSIIDGIKAGWNAAWDALKAVIDGALSSLPEWLLKIIRGGSPALEFVPIGQSMVMGIGKGWLDQWRITRMSFISDLLDLVVVGVSSAEKTGRSLGGAIVRGVEQALSDWASGTPVKGKGLGDALGMLDGKTGGMLGDVLKNRPDPGLRSPARREMMRSGKRGRGGYVFGAGAKGWGAEFWRKWHGFDDTFGIDPSKIGMAQPGINAPGGTKNLGDVAKEAAKSLEKLVTSFAEAGEIIGKMAKSWPLPPPPTTPPPRRPNDPPPVPFPKMPGRPLGDGTGAVYVYNQYGNNVVIPKGDNPKALIDSLMQAGWGTT